MKRLLTSILAFVMVLSITACREGQFKQEKHLYDNAQVKDMMNGFGTKKLGEYSIIEASSDKITLDVLTDWYFNYVSKNDYNFCIIIYTDRNDNSGVYSTKGLVQKDVIFTKDSNGDYSLSDINATSNAILYVPTNDSTLEEFKLEK